MTRQDGERQTDLFFVASDAGDAPGYMKRKRRAPRAGRGGEGPVLPSEDHGPEPEEPQSGAGPIQTETSPDNPALRNFHIGIMGNLFSGKTTLMNALSQDPYESELEDLLGGAELHTFSERVEKGSLTDECLALFYRNRVANIFPTETAFLHMRTMQQREIRHLMTRESRRGVVIVEDRPFIDGPEVFVKRMIDSGEMPPAHARLYRTLFYQTLYNERIRLPDLTVYLRSEPALLERRRAKRATEGDGYAGTITERYLREIHDCYERVASNWKQTLMRYQEHAIVPPDADFLILPAEIDMYEHPDYVHVAAGTIREKVRRMVAARKDQP